MKRILVIDDDVLTLRAIKAMIKICYPEDEVILCNSGSEGITIAELEIPDVIILDLVMPDINGYQVCQHLKSQEKTKTIPVIMISSIGQDSEVRADGFRKGADAFLSKPLDLAEMKEVINVVLRHKENEEVLRKENLDLELLIKKRTEEFYEIEDRFLQISDHDIQFFWEVDSKGKISYVSSAAEKILGYPINEIVGKRFLSFFHEHNERNRIKKLIHRYIKNNLSFRSEEHLNIQRNGTEVWMSVSGFPVFNKKELIAYRGVSHDITFRKKVEDQLLKSLKEIEEYKGKLKILNSALTLAEEKERRRIAELLHDNLGPTLSLANLKITSVLNKKLPDDVRRLLDESTILIQDSISQSRSLTYELIPLILYELGLISALKWKLDQISEIYKIKTSLKSTDDNIPISDQILILLYRIISELLLNILKHAHATAIELEVTQTAGQICISLRDNGTVPNTYSEHSPFQGQEGLGMFLIRERLDSLRGTMIIEKGPGAENIIKLFVPI
jgi:PAS domain S-box-containing protein